MGQVCQARLRDPPPSPPLNYTFKRLFGASLHYLAGVENLRRGRKVSLEGGKEKEEEEDRKKRIDT